MPRKPRVLQPNVVYHVFNRRTDRQLLFPSVHAFDDFLALIEIGKQRYGVRICAYCLMYSHWHQAVWADDATAVTRYFRWLSTIHAIRFRIRSGTRGNGHVYQDRYKSLPAVTEVHYLTLLRYIEANPVAARLVRKAEHWRWSSLADRLSGQSHIVDAGPVPLPDNWVEVVNSRWVVEEAEDQLSKDFAVD